MRVLLCFGFILLLAPPLHAEFYSWVDDSGTYNYSEDYSRVPKKYRKKMKRRDDGGQDVKPQAETKSKPVEKAAEKPVAAQGDEKLYGGKTRAAWRKELDVREAELDSIAQHMEQLRKEITGTREISNAQLESLKKDYVDSRTSYDQKYKSYSELIETVRKAGIVVEIKK